MDQSEKKRPGHKAPKGYDSGKYDKPSVACDVAILRFSEGELEVLLIERGHDPYQGYWAFPGGFVDIDESLEAAAAREVEEETGITGLSLVRLGAYGDPDRDPRTRVISSVYIALVRPESVRPRAGDDARNTGWHPVADPPELAFDHARILSDVRNRLRELAVMTPRLFDLLPERFSADDLFTLARQVMAVEQDRDAFIESLERVPCFERKGELYRFMPKEHHTGDLMFLMLGRALPVDCPEEDGG